METHPSATINIVQIKKISYSSIYQNDDLEFTYTKWGDPEKITRPATATGSPNLLFRYDRNQRLTDFIGIYQDGFNTEFWHKYYYDQAGRITIDSVYIFGIMVNGMLSYPRFIYVNVLKYDSKDRIIEEIRTSPPYDPTVYNYTYDANGNKIGPLYDQKVNYHRTNKIWMFLDREYSLNNPFNADQYNSLSLPVKVNLDGESGFQSFLGNYFTQANIEYTLR